LRASTSRYRHQKIRSSRIYAGFSMLKVGLASALALASITGSATAACCGSTVLSNDFDKYTGEYRLWTVEDAADDFKAEHRRPGWNGSLVDTGLVYYATTAFSRSSTSFASQLCKKPARPLKTKEA
jgi:hypothetical protein